MFASFGSNLKLESRIARPRGVLGHVLAIGAIPTTVEMVGDVQICDDAEAGRVVVTFPDD